MSTESTENEVSPSQQYYPSKELTDRFDISSSTLRKWCIALEEHGYYFDRTEQNRRLYTNLDIEVLSALKELVQGRKMSLENAAIIVASKFNDQRSPEGTASVPQVHNEQPVEDVVKMLQEHVERQEKFNQELLKRLDEQNRYIANRLEQRDKMLMETMNALLESRKDEIKLLEEVKEEQNKSNWFTRLFKK